MLLTLVPVLALFICSSHSAVPEFSLTSIEGLSKYIDSENGKRFYNTIHFGADGETFLVGAMDYVFSAGIASIANGNNIAFRLKSEKLSFGLDDDPLFLCQDDKRRIFCGSHVRLILPLSEVNLMKAVASNTPDLYSTSDDVLICATSGGNKGSSIYLMNGTSLSNLRRLNIEAGSALPDDDPFATPHELFYKARMLCPEYPEQKFAFMQGALTAHEKPETWVVGLWLRKFGLQLKTFSDIGIQSYTEDSMKDDRHGAISAKLSSSLFQPDDSILAGVGEFVGFHSYRIASNLETNVALAFLHQNEESKILLVDVFDTKGTEVEDDVPFENTFSKILAISIMCSSLTQSDCPRHGFCFTSRFQYPYLRDYKIVDDTIIAAFSTPSAQWGGRSAICTLSLGKLTNSFNKCAQTNSAKIGKGNLIDCTSESNNTHIANAVFEDEGTFTNLQAFRLGEEPAITLIIAAEEGRFLKGHLKSDNNRWSFTQSSSVLIPNKERVSNLAWHKLSQKIFAATETAVYAFQPSKICSNYLRIRHCMKDKDCFWDYEYRICIAKEKPSMVLSEKPCIVTMPEMVHINASQGSTVRLVCNPPCEFDSSVRWEIPSDMDKNKYLIMDDILVLFDLFAGRNRANGTANENDVVSVSCSTDLPTPGTSQPLVNFSIYKTCGAFCQRNRNMEAWCLKTWKQKIGLPNGDKILRT